METYLPYKTNKNYEIGDFLEYKKFLYHNFTQYEYIICKGVVMSVTGRTIEVQPIPIINNGLNNHYTNVGDRHYINDEHVIEHYPRTTVKNLSLRLVLKKIWSDLVFREVKTIKTRDPISVTYQYVNEHGFVRTRKFESIQESLDTVPSEYHKNIIIQYNDYYGFTTDKYIRANDKYNGKEIFFSKKCYGELNLTGNMITAKFPFPKGLNIPPRTKQYICGLVGDGEKGLFYRKWFVCSPEFLVLWTMICEPHHYSLKTQSFSNKPLPDLMKELDTSHYNVIDKYDISVEEKQKLFQVYNVEKTAIYFSDMYKKIAKAICTSRNMDREKYKDHILIPYEDRIVRDLLWMKLEMNEN
jgi:hypothetical protein